ncbi:MAG: gamma-glutamyl-gamma-aminobutyrate hydrolase family protein [Caldilineae bacterium]|nr:MAG: gamma-glutamyl-gamma-aminobutyrate hydrolase family protein [Caldilineae bacterium]
MSRPRIGFTSREKDAGYFHRWQRDYWFCILLAGGEPVRLYPEIVPDAGAVLDKLDGLILTGGGDVDPEHYGHALNGTVAHSIYPERDRMELALVQAAIEREMPLFGICRGIQVLNVALGGTLTQHVQNHAAKINSFDGSRPHLVNVRAPSLLYEILQTRSATVNSYHHQAVCSADLAPPLLATAIAPDGVIEAVEHVTHPWLLGVQWHPERLYELGEEHRRLFETFVDAADHYRRGRL